MTDYPMTGHPITDYIRALDERLTLDHELVGGKAAGLAALIEHRFPVPTGFVVTTAAYRDFVRAAGILEQPPDQVAAAIARTPIDEKVAGQILAAYAGLGRPAVAVRSSGTAEDLADASFAGQHDTYLDVRGDDAVLAAVKSCWASLWTPRAVAYRERFVHLLDDDRDLALAVVVQEMVDAQWAGVMFSVDPVTGDRRHLVIEAVRGLGESLVSGTATGERHVVDKRTRRAVGRGAHASDLPGQRDLARLGIEVERALGGPQDIEWAYADGQYRLLQARPITALPEPPATGPIRRLTAGRARRRDAARGGRRGDEFQMALDHMPYPPFPIDLDLFLLPVLDTMLGTLRSAGLSTSRTADVITEIDDGVVQINPPRPRLTPAALIGVPRAVPAAVRKLRTSIPEYREWVATTLLPLVRSIDSEDLSGLSDEELLNRIDTLLSSIGRRLPDRFGAMPRGMLADVVARRLLHRVVDDARAERLHDDLVSAVPCVTTESNAALAEMARTVRETPSLRAVYASSTPAQVADRLRASPEGREMLARVDAFLATYGFRELSIFSVGVAPLRERPDVVHSMIAGLATHDPAGSAVAVPAGPDRFEAAQDELREHAGLPARLLAGPILRLVDAGRSAIGFREDSHYLLVMTLAVARRVLLELGGRLVERGALDRADDVAYLRRSELGLPAAQMKAVVERRREARQRSLDGYTIVPAELLGRPDRDGDGAVVGTPASRGVAVGTVRIVRGEQDFGTLRPGEIMVCPFTNPTWTPLFGIAAAVVVDTGGMASHAAIVARERGIPAIMGTGNGTATLHDGQRVVVNADNGTVVPIAAGDSGDRS